MIVVHKKHMDKRVRCRGSGGKHAYVSEYGERERNIKERKNIVNIDVNV